MGRTSALVGENIRSLRLKRGLSQERLALRADLNTSYLGQIERGEKSPTVDSLEKIAQALGIELEILFHFNILSSQQEETTFIERVVFELKGRTAQEQKDIYELVVQILKFKDKK